LLRSVAHLSAFDVELALSHNNYSCDILVCAVEGFFQVAFFKGKFLLPASQTGFKDLFVLISSYNN